MDFSQIHAKATKSGWGRVPHLGIGFCLCLLVLFRSLVFFCFSCCVRMYFFVCVHELLYDCALFCVPQDVFHFSSLFVVVFFEVSSLLATCCIPWVQDCSFEQKKSLRSQGITKHPFLRMIDSTSFC